MARTWTQGWGRNKYSLRYKIFVFKPYGLSSSSVYIFTTQVWGFLESVLILSKDDIDVTMWLIFFEETTIISIELYVESLDILETLNEFDCIYIVYAKYLDIILQLG
jgi:hypothetical protein